jgi:hypothetical protein
MLRGKINGSVMKFSRVYNLSFEIKEENAFASLKSLMDAVSESKNPRLLVLIDEYDRFAKKLMVENLPAYDGAVTGVSSSISHPSLLRDYQGRYPRVEGLQIDHLWCHSHCTRRRFWSKQHQQTNHFRCNSCRCLWIHTSRSFKGTRGNWRERRRKKSRS